MEHIQIHEELRALHKLAEDYERELKTFGLELNDLPDDCVLQLKNYATIKDQTKLHDLSGNYFQEFYYRKKKEKIDNLLVTSKLSSDIKRLEKQIDAEEKEIKELEKFTSGVSKRIVSEAEMEHNTILIEKKMAGIIERQPSLSTPKDVNIDEIISKIEKLEKQKQNP